MKGYWRRKISPNFSWIIIKIHGTIKKIISSMTNNFFLICRNGLLCSSFLSLFLMGCARNSDPNIPAPIFEAVSEEFLTNFEFDGKWVGNLELNRVIPGKAEFQNQGAETVSVIIEGNTVQFNNPVFNDLKMQYERHKTNITFGFSHSDKDPYGWVETQLFIATPIDSNSMWLFKSRIVNNVSLDISKPQSKFGNVAIGVLKRRESSK